MMVCIRSGHNLPSGDTPEGPLENARREEPNGGCFMQSGEVTHTCERGEGVVVDNIYGLVSSVYRFVP